MSKVGARVATDGGVLRRRTPSSSRDEIGVLQHRVPDQVRTLNQVRAKKISKEAGHHMLQYTHS